MASRAPAPASASAVPTEKERIETEAKSSLADAEAAKAERAKRRSAATAAHESSRGVRDEIDRLNRETTRPDKYSSDTEFADTLGVAPRTDARNDDPLSSVVFLQNIPIMPLTEVNKDGATVDKVLNIKNFLRKITTKFWENVPGYKPGVIVQDGIEIAVDGEKTLGFAYITFRSPAEAQFAAKSFCLNKFPGEANNYVATTLDELSPFLAAGCDVSAASSFKTELVKEVKVVADCSACARAAADRALTHSCAFFAREKRTPSRDVCIVERAEAIKRAAAAERLGSGAKSSGGGGGASSKAAKDSRAKVVADAAAEASAAAATLNCMGCKELMGGDGKLAHSCDSYWLFDDQCRDEYVLRYAVQGAKKVDGKGYLDVHETEVAWANVRGGPDPDYAGERFTSMSPRRSWTESFVRWSPAGTFLATVHPQGVKLWSGKQFKGETRLIHMSDSMYPCVYDVLWSPNERYVCTWSGVRNNRDTASRAFVVWDVRTGREVRAFKQAEQDDEIRRLQEQGRYWAWSSDSKYLARIVTKVNPERDNPALKTGKMAALDFIEIYAEVIVDGAEASFYQVESRAAPGARGLAWSPKRPAHTLEDGSGKARASTHAPILSWWTPEVDKHDYTFEELAFLTFLRDREEAAKPKEDKATGADKGKNAKKPETPKNNSSDSTKIDTKQKMVDYVTALSKGVAPFAPPPEKEKPKDDEDTATAVRRDPLAIEPIHPYARMLRWSAADFKAEYERMVLWAKGEPARLEASLPAAPMTASFLRVMPPTDGGKATTELVKQVRQLLVQNESMLWSPQGDYCSVVAESITAQQKVRIKHKTGGRNIDAPIDLKKMASEGFIIKIVSFKGAGKSDPPLDELKIKEHVHAFAWEPHAARFAVLLSPPPAPAGAVAAASAAAGAGASTGLLGTSAYSRSIAFYTFSEKSRWTRTHEIDHSALGGALYQNLFWSPLGEHLVMADEKFNTLKFLDCKEYKTLDTRENMTGARALEWDPSGRMVATIKAVPYPVPDHNGGWMKASHISGSDEQSNGFTLWSYQGARITSVEKYKAFQFSWRPRPVGLLSESELLHVRSTLRDFVNRYQDEDKARASRSALLKRLVKRRAIEDFRALLEDREAAARVSSASRVESEDDAVQRVALEEVGVSDEVDYEVVLVKVGEIAFQEVVSRVD